MARAFASSALRRLLCTTSPPPPPTPFRPVSSSYSTASDNPISMARKPRPPARTRNATPSTGTISDLVHKSRLYNLSFYRSLYPLRTSPRRKIKRVHLPTHYVEVSYKIRKAVVFYQPSIAHIPHGIKDRNPLLVISGARRGQNT